MAWIWFLALLLVLGLLFLYLTLPGRASKAQLAPFRGVNHAHRGLYTPEGIPPENSLPAFAAAKEAGYGIELDVQLSSDEQVVVFHDDDLARVCGVNSRVDHYTYQALQNFSLAGSTERIPLFSQVLALLDGAVPLIVELKMGPKNDRLCQLTYEILKEYKGPVCVESFDPRIVRWFKKNAPELLRGQLSAPPSVLETGLAGRLVGWGLTNFLGRPQFIAYQTAKHPFPVSFARLFAFRVVWTLMPEHDAAAWLQKNDAAIFEHYRPTPRFTPPT